jgi:hypothetical protein
MLLSMLLLLDRRASRLGRERAGLDLGQHQQQRAGARGNLRLLLAGEARAVRREADGRQRCDCLLLGPLPVGASALAGGQRGVKQRIVPVADEAPVNAESLQPVLDRPAALLDGLLRVRQGRLVLELLGGLVQQPLGLRVIPALGGRPPLRQQGLNLGVEHRQAAALGLFPVQGNQDGGDQKHQPDRRQDPDQGGQGGLAPRPLDGALPGPHAPRVDRLAVEEAFQVVGQGGG